MFEVKRSSLLLIWLKEAVCGGWHTEAPVVKVTEVVSQPDSLDIKTFIMKSSCQQLINCFPSQVDWRLISRIITTVRQENTERTFCRCKQNHFADPKRPKKWKQNERPWSTNQALTGKPLPCLVGLVWVDQIVPLVWDCLHWPCGCECRQKSAVQIRPCHSL